MKKILQKVFAIALVLSFWQSAVAQEMSGETHPDTGVASYTYTVTTQNQLLNPAWTIVNGTKLSSGNTGTTYWVNVQFTSTGAGSVTLKKGLTTISSLPVTIVAPPDPPATPTEQDNCGNSVLTGGTPPAGVTWYWQTSSTGTDVSNSNTTYTVTSSGTYYLRAKATNYSNWSIASASKNVTVYTTPAGGTIASPSPYYNFASGSLTLTGNTGTISKWQSRPSGGSWADISGTSGLSTINFSGIDDNTDFQAVITNGPCVATSSIATLTVIQQNFEGTISGTTGVVSGSGGSLLLSNCTGAVNEWQYSNDNSTWVSIANSASTTLNFGSLTAKRYFRAKVTKKSTTSYTASFTVKCYAPLTHEFLGETHPDTSTPSYTYSIQVDNAYIGTDNWLVNGGTVLSHGYTSPSYWANVQFTTPGAGSVTFTIDQTALGSLPVTITSPPNTPSTPSEQDNCGNSVLTRGTPPAGVTWYWQTSSTGTDVSNSNPTYTATVSGPVYLRAKLNNYNNWSVASASVNVTIATPPVGGTLPSPPNNFYNSATGQLTLSGYTGNISKWQSAPIGGSTWTDISNTLTTYNFSSAITSTQYRAVLTNGPCVTYSPAATVNVIQLNFEGTISGSTKLIGTVNSGTLTLNNCTGTVNEWQYSLNGTDWTSIANMSSTLSISNLTVSTYYRVKVTKGSTISYSSQFLVNQYPAITQNISAFNYTEQEAMQVKEPNPANLPNYNGSQKVTSFTYKDGLGRSVQNVTKSQSFTQKDIVSFSVYDPLGRQLREYLPYTASGSNFYASPLTDQLSFYSGTSKVATDTKPYAETVFENSPLQRVIEQGGMGSDFQPGTTHTVLTLQRTNIANEVRIWKTDGTSPAYYDAATLGVKEVTDENGNKVITFTDKQGRMLQKRVQANATDWLTTLYIYETWGPLKYVLQPEGVRQLGAGTTISSTLFDSYAFKYKYDALGRLVEKNVPGATAPIYYCYDPLDRLVLVQDGNLRTSNQWMFVKYDAQKRPVMTGSYTNTAITDRSLLQQNVLDVLYSSGAWYEERSSTGTLGYTNQSFPTSNTTVLSANYYDNYDFDNNGTRDYKYDSLQAPGTTSEWRPFGMATGNKKLVLGTTTWLYNYVFYDRYGRVIQSRSNNHLSTTLDNLTTIVYNFDGTVSTIKTYHNAGSTNQYTLVQKNSYDRGRLFQVKHNINNASVDQVVAQYEYNELGQMVDKKLHQLPDTKFLQSVDYRYNIQGRLASINNAQLIGDGSLNNNDDADSEVSDFFGMELFYQTVESSGLGNATQYNGNLSAVKWKNGGASGAIDQRSYKFGYDKSDRLLTSSFQANTGSAWTKEANTLNENITYDFNGNILTLNRNQNLRGLSGTTVTSAAQTMDNLTYTYASGNQLSNVADAASQTIGFKDVTNPSSTTEYTYYPNGSLTADLNKGISAIIYNVLGKPQQITFADGRVVNYAYDAAGAKLTTSTSSTTTNYSGGFVYNTTGTTNTLNFFSSPEGRVVKNGGNFEYQYVIADHQGNARILFTSALPVADVKTATFESANQATEAGQFNNYGHISAGHSNGMYSQYLNGGYAGMVGVAKSYTVYPGDQLKIEAYGSYNVIGGSSSLTNFAGALLTAFNLSAPVAGETHTASAAINTWGGIEAGGYADGTSDLTDPKAFVNIILFDKDYNFLDVAYAQLKGSSLYYMTASYTVKEAGYAYLYVSNEQASQTDVYFDDVKMTYTPTAVIQSNEYYPFGLQTNKSWTRVNNVGNNFLANGGTELNATSSLYDLEFRNYDPVLGRMNQVDPMAEKYYRFTPFNYAFNSPVVYNDVNGADPIPHWYDNPKIIHPVKKATSGSVKPMRKIDLSKYTNYHPSVDLTPPPFTGDEVILPGPPRNPLDQDTDAPNEYYFGTDKTYTEIRLEVMTKRIDAWMGYLEDREKLRKGEMTLDEFGTKYPKVYTGNVFTGNITIRSESIFQNKVWSFNSNENSTFSASRSIYQDRGWSADFNKGSVVNSMMWNNRQSQTEIIETNGMGFFYMNTFLHEQYFRINLHLK